MNGLEDRFEILEFTQIDVDSRGTGGRGEDRDIVFFFLGFFVFSHEGDEVAARFGLLFPDVAFIARGFSDLAL